MKNILLTKIKKKKIIVGVIGLGYVGLELALTVVRKKFKTYLFDIDKEKVRNLKKNISPLKTIKKKELALIFIIWVMFPYSWVWQGHLRESMFQYNVAYVLNYFFDIFNTNVKSSTIWPFGRFGR